MQKNDVYEDSYMRERIRKIISVQEQGKIIISLYPNDMGLLRADDLNLNPQRLYNCQHDYALGSIGFMDNNYETGQFVFTLKQGEKLPKALENYKVLQLGEAVVDSSKRICTIATKSEQITFTGVEPWKGGYNIVREINRELAVANAGVVVWRLTILPEESSAQQRLYQKGVPTVANNETSLPVSGYAYQEYINKLVYMGMVGYKTAVQSVTATVWQGKGMALRIPGESSTTLIPEGKYERTTNPMTEYESHHCVLMSHAATPGKWSPEDEYIYLLYFIGCDTIQDQFISRLNESLNIPILPEWADRIMVEGRENNYIQDLKTGGDCVAGISIRVKNADWGKLVEDLLVIEELTL